MVLNIVNNQWAISTFQGIALGGAGTFAARGLLAWAFEHKDQTDLGVRIPATLWLCIGASGTRVGIPENPRIGLVPPPPADVAPARADSPSILDRVGAAYGVELSVGRAAPPSVKDPDYVVRAIEMRDVEGLTVTAKVPRDRLKTALGRLDRAIWVTGPVAVTLALVIAVVLARSLSRPLVALARETREVVAGAPRRVLWSSRRWAVATRRCSVSIESRDTAVHGFTRSINRTSLLNTLPMPARLR